MDALDNKPICKAKRRTPVPEPNDWIVSVCNSESDTISSSLVRGTEGQVKAHMLKIAADGRVAYNGNYGSDWEDGPETEADISASGDGASLCCCCQYADSHTLISACVCPPVKPLTA